jgi:rare lipoprotein A
VRFSTPILTILATLITIMTTVIIFPTSIERAEAAIAPYFTAPAPKPIPAELLYPPPPRPFLLGARVVRSQTGTASWYGKKHRGRLTASGARFDPDALTVAHPTYPMGSTVLVTNLANKRVVVACVNDRGPYTKGRIVDLSERAAKQLGVGKRGVLRVRLDVMRGIPSSCRRA